MSSGKKNPDCLIIGAGIFGLWSARHAILRGEEVLVFDEGKAGSGASGGFMGALMPHTPDRWNLKKQMQFEALSSIDQAVAALENDTGMDCGFLRCGRLMPLTHAKMPEHASKRISGSLKNWSGEFSMSKMDLPFKQSLAENWLSPEIGTYGALYDTLSARINPRKYIAALAEFARSHHALCENIKVSAIDENRICVKLANGEEISAGRIIIANGYQAYPLINSIKGMFQTQPITGRGVKGQAMLLEYEHNDTLPIVYDNGSYIIPHADNKIGIGSTSINDWQESNCPQADEFDHDDMQFYQHAMKLVPCLRDAPIIEHWAGIRPRNTLPDLKTGKIGSEPIVAPLDGHKDISVAIGGFKIGLALAHFMTK